VADASANPALLAVDLVSQAEHDPDASTTLVTTDRSLLDSVTPFLESEVARAARREVVEASLAKSRAVVVLDEDQAAEVVNDLAPEHLEVLLPNARAFVEKVRNAGAIFLGEWSAVPFGDYGVASNHVLPTAGTARFASGLRAADFVTVSSVVEMDRSAVERSAPETATIAKAEGFEGHARAMEFRAEQER
jgi:histidinol dehydrogenase